MSNNTVVPVRADGSGRSEAMTEQITQYARRKACAWARLRELETTIEAILAGQCDGVADVVGCPRGWALREAVFLTLERLPKREMAAWLDENEQRLQRAVGVCAETRRQ